MDNPGRLESGGRERLVQRLDELGIRTEIVPYPEHGSVEEGKALRGDHLGGCFTKNLLLQDKKRRLFLLVTDEDRAIDLKRLHLSIGANGQLRFAPPATMHAVLDVLPGTLTPLALINDVGGAVTVVIDAELLKADQLNFHPLVHTESIGIGPQELLAFITSCERKPVILDFAEVPGDV
ncbi:MAG: prolyl-tRNA synthetase associated domain-containing protein [Candidatus Velthaea sp.]